MPDTPIDQSGNIQSIRMKVPTGTVPIPPAGFAQLHSPSSGTLALRLPDGSVVPIGGGGGTPAVLAGTGGVVEALSNPFTGAGITLTPDAGETIRFNGPVVGIDLLPFGAQVVPTTLTSVALQALWDTPITLIPAIPGVTILPIACFLLPTPGATPYQTVDGDQALSWGYGVQPADEGAGYTHPFPAFEVGNTNALAALNSDTLVPMQLFGLSGSLAGMIGQPFVLGLGSGRDALTDGDGTAKVVVVCAFA